MPRLLHCLGKQVFNYVSVDIRQPGSTPLMLEGQALVIDAKEVHDGRMEIVHMNSIANHGWLPSSGGAKPASTTAAMPG